MNIYFSCSITGGRNDQGIYQKIVDFLIREGHEVPTAHLSKLDVMKDERVVDALEVYNRDVNWVMQCDVLIAEVSTPSHGVGYEIALAVFQDKPVLCCYREGQTVSKMILGNKHTNLTTFAYSDEENLLKMMDEYLANIDLH